MKWPLEEKVLASGFGVILLLLGWANLMSLKNTTELAENARQVQETYDILGNLTDFYAAMSIAESGRRGYVFSGRQAELNRHQTAVQEMQAELLQLQQETASDPEQQQRIQQISNLAAQRIGLFQQSVALYQRDRSDTAMQTQNAITDESVQIREQIQNLLTEVKTTESQELQSSLARSRSNIQKRSITERISILLSLLTIGSVIVLFYRSQTRREQIQTLEQTLAQEQELSQLKLQLFSMVSHEFRTPLSVILTSSQLLAEILEPRIEQTQLKNLYRIQTSAKLINRLITDILTLTRAEAGKLECQPEWIDVEAFCLNLLDSLQASDNLQHSLQFTSEAQCGRIYVDEKLLHSILSNLLLNAIKYSPAGSQIALRLHCDSEQVRFEVQDQGIGILPADRDSIFSPFYRGQNVEAMTGSGLGLAVVQKCLELLNGTIQIETEAEARTRFLVSIPCPQK